KKCRGIVFWFLMQSTLALRQPMMISREATMLSSRLAVLLSAFYHRLIIAHEASSFHCDAGLVECSVLLHGSTLSASSGRRKISRFQ
ncbi:hypothetical protein ACYUNW_005609, partial [Klebsiella pneumoniae]